MRHVIAIAKPVGAISPEEGAKTIVYLAASPEPAEISGAYFVKCKVATPTREAENDEEAKRLWGVSVKLAGTGT